MATMGFAPYPGPDATKILHIAEYSGTQTFKKGDLVVLTTGQVAIIANDEQAWGIALKDASGTQGTILPVYTITPEARFIAEATATTTEAMRGIAYELDVVTTIMGVDTATTSSPTFVVDELDPRDGATTGAGGRVIGRFYPASCQSIGG